MRSHIILRRRLENGYWTFDLIKKEIESYGTVTLTSNKHDSTCTLTGDNTINLKNFGPLLGFATNKTITSNTGIKLGQVNIDQGLKFIKILCDVVDKWNTIFNSNKTNVLLTLPTTTTQSLKG